MFAWIRKVYGNPDGVSFWLGLHFFQLSSLWNWCTLTRETSFDPALPSQVATVWIILQISFFDCVASYLFHMAFLISEMCFNVSFSRDT